MQTTFTIEEIKKYIISQDSLGDVLYNLNEKKIIEAVACEQLDIFKAALLFTKTEGIVPAPETAHAIKAVIDIAERETQEKCIVFNFSGHGFFDLASYDKYLAGELQNYAHPTSEIERALKELPKL